LVAFSSYWICYVNLWGVVGIVVFRVPGLADQSNNRKFFRFESQPPGGTVFHGSDFGRLRRLQFMDSCGHYIQYPYVCSVDTIAMCSSSSL